MVGKTDCCCCQVLFTQPDFVNQKSHLEDTSAISTQSTTVNSTLSSSIGEWQNWLTEALQRQQTWRRWKNLRECLDNVPHVLIQWWASSQIYWFTLSDILLISSVTPTVQLTLSAHMVKAWLVQKQLGQIANIMAIAHCPTHCFKDQERAWSEVWWSVFNTVNKHLLEFLNATSLPEIFILVQCYHIQLTWLNAVSKIVEHHHLVRKPNSSAEDIAEIWDEFLNQTSWTRGKCA